MLATIQIDKKNYSVDFSKPIDLSIPLRQGESVNAFHIPFARFEPIRVGGFVGSVQEGGSANCENLFLNAHGNGTHTECVGHISKDRITINQCLKQFVFVAKLVSIEPLSNADGDFLITKQQVEHFITDKKSDALIIRTLPNSVEKNIKNYSGTNPTYLHHEAARYIREQGIKHLLIDLPSVDREEDNGLLLAHKAFWNYPENPQLDSTISELIYVPDTITDGTYLLNIQIVSFESDASPSKPILYSLSS